MANIFINFLDALDSHENHVLIEAVKQGYTAMLEFGPDNQRLARNIFNRNPDFKLNHVPDTSFAQSEFSPEHNIVHSTIPHGEHFDNGCPDCGGTGTIPCKTCKGTGKLKSGNDCLRCDGTGLIKCATCGGTGKQIDPIEAKRNKELSNNKWAIKNTEGMTPEQRSKYYQKIYLAGLKQKKR